MSIELDTKCAAAIGWTNLRPSAFEDGRIIGRMPDGDNSLVPRFSEKIEAAFLLLEDPKVCCWSMKYDHESKLCTVQLEIEGGRYLAQHPTVAQAIANAFVTGMGDIGVK